MVHTDTVLCKMASSNRNQVMFDTFTLHLNLQLSVSKWMQNSPVLNALLHCNSAEDVLLKQHITPGEIVSCRDSVLALEHTVTQQITYFSILICFTLKSGFLLVGLKSTLVQYVVVVPNFRAFHMLHRIHQSNHKVLFKAPKSSRPWFLLLLLLVVRKPFESPKGTRNMATKWWHQCLWVWPIGTMDSLVTKP